MKKGDKVYINLDYCAQLQDAIDFVEWFEFCKKNENIPIEIDTGENGEIYIGGYYFTKNEIITQKEYEFKQELQKILKE